MGKAVFVAKILMILAVFFILALLFIVNPLNKANSFFKNPFKPDISIDTKNSFYDLERGRLRIVIEKQKGINGNYISFSFKDEGITKDYFLETQLINEKTVFYFDVSKCLGDFETITVSLNDETKKSYFTKEVEIKREGIVGDNLYHNLCSFCQNEGDGTKNSPLTICSCNELQNISNNLDGYFELGSTVDCNDYNGFTSIGDNFDPFTGELNGNGNIIYGLNINQPNNSYVGLFGVLYNGKIENLGIRNSTINGGIFSGGIVGRQEGGEISKVFIENSKVSGSANVGGITGYSNSKIVNSYSRANITSLIFGGGISGGCECEIDNSYFAGKIDSSYNGLIGNRLLDSELNDCYFDSNLMDTVTTYGCEPVLTSEFSSIDSFSNSNWQIKSNDVYPTLKF